MTDVIKEDEFDGILTPRMKRMWDFYVKPSSNSFGNALQSALKAGYTDETAHVITGQRWFKTKKRRMQLLGKAEEALQEAVTMDITDAEGNTKADLARVKLDAAKFIAKTQGKEDGYSERTEVTGANGQGIVFMPVELMDKYNLEKDGTNTEQSD